MNNLIGFKLLNLNNKGPRTQEKRPGLTLSNNGIAIYHFPNVDNVEAVQITYNEETNELCVIPAQKTDSSVITRQKDGSGGYYYNSSSLAAKDVSKMLCKTDKQEWIYRAFGTHYKTVNGVVFALDSLVEGKIRTRHINKEAK